MVSHTDLLTNLYNAFNPFEPLPAGDPKYVDCQQVRGDADILNELGNRMRLAKTNTCQLYSGHRGGGKSTELHEEAIASYDKALEIKPDFHEAWNNRGNALGNLGRNEDAIASYDKALEIKPDYHRAWRSRGYALYNLGRYEEAIASFNKVLEIKPEDYETWNNRGYLLLKPDSSEGMTAVYDKALEIGLHLRNLHNNLERYEEALSNFDKALEIQPDFALTWANRSFSLYYLGRYEEALTSCNKAIELIPDDYVAWSNQGFALMKIERFEEAIISFDKVLKLKFDNHGAWYKKACCYALQGNVELALENLQQAINMSPEEYQKMAKTDSDFDDLRGNDCFQALIK